MSCHPPSPRATPVLRGPNQGVSCAGPHVGPPAMVDPRTSSHCKSCRLPGQAQVQAYAESLDRGADQYTPVYQGLAVSCALNLIRTSTARPLRL